MRKFAAGFIVLFCLFQVAQANDIRAKVTNSSVSGLQTNVINPDKHIYGIPWGSNEDEFIAKWGNPDGYVRFNAQETGMIYGKQHMFLFFNGKLSGLRLTDNILDWQLSKKLLPNPVFDGVQWKLNNGIEKETDLAKVKKTLGNTLTNERYETYYETERAKVTLNLSHYTDAGDNDEAYKVYGIMIESK